MSEYRICPQCRQKKGYRSFKIGSDLCGRCRGKRKINELPFLHPVINAFLRNPA